MAVTVMTLQTRVRYNTEERWLGLAEETNVTATVSETNLYNVKHNLKHQKPQRGSNTGIPNADDIEETRATLEYE